MPEIIIKYADKVIERVVTEKNHISIGRTADNDIVLDSSGVSRRHARIELANNASEVIDLDSLNGTFVNQMKVIRQFLHDNDKITIGKYDLLFYRESQTSAKLFDDASGKILERDQQSEFSQTLNHNPLESLMETRPIPISPSSDAKTDRKEHRKNA
ncbi:MAG: FHA domain-containing protein [Candidatus Zixiibacteriota bacterium]